MNNSNSFNVCPQCGCSNSLSARFCARCGSKLTVPDEVVVCPKCHTRNSPLANYCRNCGAAIKVGAVSKICPKCGREVNAEDNVCSCGHSFANVSNSQSAVPPVVDADATAKTQSADINNAQEVKKAKKGGRGKGRVIAFFAFLFAIAFTYFLIVPAAISVNGAVWNLHDIPAINSFTRFFYSTQTDGEKSFYGYDVVLSLVAGVSRNELSGLTVADWIAVISVCVFALVIVIYLLVAFIRLFSGRRSKGANIFLLIMAILSSLVGLLTWLGTAGIVSSTGSFIDVVMQEFIPSIFSVDYGYIIAIPVFYWFFFIYSACAKQKKGKKKDSKSSRYRD